MPFSFSIETQVNATPERVFDVATALDAAMHWMNDIVSITKTTDGPFAVGTEWDETRKQMGKAATEHFEVTELEPPRKISLYVDGAKGSTKKGEYRFTYLIEPHTAGTKLTMLGTIDMPGRFATLMSKLFGWIFVKAMRRDLAAMKAYAEGETP